MTVKKSFISRTHFFFYHSVTFIMSPHKICKSTTPVLNVRVKNNVIKSPKSTPLTGYERKKRCLEKKRLLFSPVSYTTICSWLYIIFQKWCALRIGTNGLIRHHQKDEFYMNGNRFWFNLSILVILNPNNEKYCFFPISKRCQKRPKQGFLT